LRGADRCNVSSKTSVQEAVKLQERGHNAPDQVAAANRGWSPELDLLLLCARWPQRPEDCQLIRARVTGQIDWQRFLQVVQHHRILPLVSHNLLACWTDSVPAELAPVAARLRDLAAASAYQSLRNLSELRRVLQKLKAQTVSVRVMKGLPLAQTIFGNLSLRSPGDLDLLIDESAIGETDQVLRGFGYQGSFALERFSPKRLAFYRTHWKDLVYLNPATGLEVDVHWRCFRNSAMPGATLCAASGNETVSFGGFQVETLPRMESLLYLCVHGTLDGWLYLKALVDVAAQVREMTETELDSLAGLAQCHGVLPELSASLQLVRRYLTMDHWSGLLLPESDATVTHILRYADQVLVQGAFLAERESIPIATTLIFELGLRRNFRYRRELLLRVLFRARMWETIPLPDFLFGIYPLLSPVEWAIFRMRQWLAKPASNRTLTI
jgi:hypothetical protein